MSRTKARRFPAFLFSLLSLVLISSLHAVCAQPDARPPRARDAREKKILRVIQKIEENRSLRYLNVPRADGRVLRLLTESAGARHVVEIGTSTGYSGLWICLALKKTGGRLTTYEIDPERAAIARRHFKQAGVEGMVRIIIGDAHKEVVKLKEPIDVLFLDADKSGYLDYLKKLLPLVRPGGLILAHNTTFPPPDPKFIKAVTESPALETIFWNVSRAGMGVTLKKR